MSGPDLEITTDPGTVWRVGFVPDPWAWTPWVYATDAGLFGGAMVWAVVRARGQITLPREVREALHVDEGDDVAFVVEGGQVTMHGLKSIPADQAWFWSDDWQAGEREASGQLARDEGAVFEDGAAFLDSLA